MLHSNHSIQFRIILSSDTDVFVLSVYQMETIFIELEEIELIFDLYIKDRQLLSVNKCIEKLGAAKARTLPGMHAFTGCDQISKMSTVKKAKAEAFFEF